MSCLSHGDYEGDNEPRLHVLMRFCLDPCVLKNCLQTLRTLHLGAPMVHPDKDRYQKIEYELRCEVQGCFWYSLASPHLRLMALPTLGSL